MRFSWCLQGRVQTLQAMHKCICQISDTDLCSSQKVGEISFPRSQLLAKELTVDTCSGRLISIDVGRPGRGWCDALGVGGGGRKVGRRGGGLTLRLLGPDEGKVIKLQ